MRYSFFLRRKKKRGYGDGGCENTELSSMVLEQNRAVALSLQVL